MESCPESENDNHHDDDFTNRLSTCKLSIQSIDKPHTAISYWLDNILQGN
jgi:hypothetical protein